MTDEKGEGMDLGSQQHSARKLPGLVALEGVLLSQQTVGSLRAINSLNNAPCPIGRTVLFISQQVRTIISRLQREEAQKLGRSNDARQLLERLQVENCFVRFQMDKDGRVTRIAWAVDEQKRNAMRYYPIIIQDNTFNTNR